MTKLHSTHEKWEKNDEFKSFQNSNQTERADKRSQWKLLPLGGCIALS